MSHKPLAYGASFLLHTFLVAVFWLFSMQTYKINKPIEIDLSFVELEKVEKPQRNEYKVQEQKVVSERKPEKKASEQKPLMAKSYEKPSKDLQEVQPTSSEVIKDQPITDAQGKEKAQSLHSGEVKAQAIAGTNTSEEKQTTQKVYSPPPEEQRELYIKEKLSVISQIVQKNISYPPVARRMGWEGRVVLSIHLKRDGTLEKVVIEQSSGYELLDRNAVETVKRVAALFPKPPVDVVLRLPISYKLE